MVLQERAVPYPSHASTDDQADDVGINGHSQRRITNQIDSRDLLIAPLRIQRVGQRLAFFLRHALGERVDCSDELRP